MALNIKIDFNDCYPIKLLKDNFSLSFFNSTLQTGEEIPIGINISDEPHPLIPNVYNLAFGPLGVNNQIDDKVKLCHQNYSKLFSTIVFTGLSFLRSNREKFLGIDGSSNARAYMYYRCMQNNYDYLKQFINIYGVNYYIRILRKIKEDDDCIPFDEEDIKTLPQTIVRHSSIKYEKLHNYFIFNLIQ